LFSSCSEKNNPSKDIIECDFKLEILAESDERYRLLEDLQSIAITDTNDAWTWAKNCKEAKEQFRSFIEVGTNIVLASDSFSDKEDVEIKIEEHYRDFSSRPMRTKHENPSSHYLLDGLVKNIEGSFFETKVGWIPPAVGTIPLNSVNAQNIPVGNGNLIVLNSSIFSFCHEFIKSSLYALDPESDETESHIRLSKFLEDIANNRRIKSHVRPDPDYYDLHQIMLEAMELFVVGHEFSHLYLDHNGILKENVEIDSGGKIKADNLWYSWKNEIEADIFAYRFLADVLSKRVNKGKLSEEYLGYAMLAPPLFLKLSQVKDEAVAVYNDIDKNISYSVQMDDSINEVVETYLNNDSFWTEKIPTYHDLSVPELLHPISANLGSHPPNQLRFEQMEKLSANWIINAPIGMDTSGSLISETMLENLQNMWTAIRNAWIQIKINNQK